MAEFAKNKHMIISEIEKASEELKNQFIGDITKILVLNSSTGREISDDDKTKLTKVIQNGKTEHKSNTAEIDSEIFKKMAEIDKSMATLLKTAVDKSTEIINKFTKTSNGMTGGARQSIFFLFAVLVFYPACIGGMIYGIVSILDNIPDGDSASIDKQAYIGVLSLLIAVFSAIDICIIHGIFYGHIDVSVDAPIRPEVDAVAIQGNQVDMEDIRVGTEVDTGYNIPIIFSDDEIPSAMVEYSKMKIVDALAIMPTVEELIHHYIGETPQDNEGIKLAIEVFTEKLTSEMNDTDDTGFNPQMSPVILNFFNIIDHLSKKLISTSSDENAGPELTQELSDQPLALTVQQLDDKAKAILPIVFTIIDKYLPRPPGVSPTSGGMRMNRRKRNMKTRMRSRKTQKGQPARNRRTQKPQPVRRRRTHRRKHRRTRK